MLHLWYFLANYVNYSMVALALIAPLVSPRMGHPLRFWGSTALAIGFAVLLAEAGKRWSVWPGHPTFPSGHETFALAVGTCLVRRDWRWLVLVLPLVLLLGWSLVYAGWHRPVDVWGAVLTGPTMGWLFQSNWFLSWWSGQPAKPPQGV